MKKIVTAITTTTIAFSGASALSVSADAHEVVKKDTLWGISQKHGTTVDELMEWNKLSSTLIYPGDKISTSDDDKNKPKATVKEKDKKSKKKNKSDSSTHTVVDGDTLSEIAFEYGVSYEELMEWNDLSTTLIHPDQELKVKKDSGESNQSSSEEKVESEETEEKEETEKVESETEDNESQEAAEDKSEKEEVKQESEKEEVTSESDDEESSESKDDTNETTEETDSDKQDTKNEIKASSGDTYTVNEVDTLSEIGFAHGVTHEQLKEWNGISTTLILPGNEIIVKEPETTNDSSETEKDNEVEKESVEEETSNEESADSNNEESSEDTSSEVQSSEEATTEEEEPKQEEPEEEEVKAEEVEQNETTESDSSSESENKTMTMEATAYTAECEGCTGITSTGIDLNEDRNKKVIAVDPSVIPLGSTVKVEGYGTAVAGDIGGAIKGDIIDLHMPTTEDAMNWGRQQVNVEIID